MGWFLSAQELVKVGNLEKMQALSLLETLDTSLEDGVISLKEIHLYSTKQNLRTFYKSVEAATASNTAASFTTSVSPKDGLYGNQPSSAYASLVFASQELLFGYMWRRLPHSSCSSSLSWKRLDQSLDAAVETLLEDKSFRALPRKNQPLWACFLEKIRKVNALGGPRVRVVWWRTLLVMNRLPRYPDDSEHILDLEDLVSSWLSRCDANGAVDGHHLSVRFLSHRWERPHYCEKCGDGTCSVVAHPDTEDNIKARVLGEWGRDLYNEDDPRPFRPEDTYFWIDHACIDQDNAPSKMSGITLLPLCIACCANGLVCFVGSTREYADRAWTALERVLAYCLTASPHFRMIDSGYLYTHKSISCADLSVTDPHWWKIIGGQPYMIIHRPTEGVITVPTDSILIRRIAKLAAKLEPIDYFQAKSKVIFGTTACPVRQVSRVGNMLERRQHNRRNVIYPFALEDDADKGNSNITSLISRLAAIS